MEMVKTLSDRKMRKRRKVYHLEDTVMKFSTLIQASVAALVAVSFTAGQSSAAPKIPCNTAKLIVPWKAGGGTQVLFAIFEKTIAESGVKPKLKLVMIPGQGGNKGAKEAKKAKADGCTLFAIHQSAFTSYFNGRIKFSATSC